MTLMSNIWQELTAGNIGVPGKEGVGVEADNHVLHRSSRGRGRQLTRGPLIQLMSGIPLENNDLVMTLASCLILCSQPS